MTEHLEYEARNVGLRVNITTPNSTSLYLSHQRFVRVSEFVYLGGVIGKTGGTERDVS